MRRNPKALRMNAGYIAKIPIPLNGGRWHLVWWLSDAKARRLEKYIRRYNRRKK